MADSAFHTTASYVVDNLEWRYFKLCLSPFKRKSRVLLTSFIPRKSGVIQDQILWLGRTHNSTNHHSWSDNRNSIQCNCTNSKCTITWNWRARSYHESITHSLVNGQGGLSWAERLHSPSHVYVAYLIIFCAGYCHTCRQYCWFFFFFFLDISRLRALCVRVYVGGWACGARSVVELAQCFFRSWWHGTFSSMIIIRTTQPSRPPSALMMEPREARPSSKGWEFILNKDPRVSTRQNCLKEYKFRLFSWLSLVLCMHEATVL